MPHYPDTEHETRRCPRRHLLDHPDVVDILRLHHDVEGIDGMRRRKKLTTVALDGLAIVADAHAWRIREQQKEDAQS